MQFVTVACPHTSTHTVINWNINKFLSHDQSKVLQDRASSPIDSSPLLTQCPRWYDYLSLTGPGRPGPLTLQTDHSVLLSFSELDTCHQGEEWGGNLAFSTPWLKFQFYACLPSLGGLSCYKGLTSTIIFISLINKSANICNIPIPAALVRLYSVWWGRLRVCCCSQSAGDRVRFPQ